MRFSFLIVDNDPAVIKHTLALFENFPNYFCAAVVTDCESAIDEIYKLKPQLVIVGIPFDGKDSSLSFSAIAELHQYSESIPYFVALASTPNFAFDAIQSGFSDYLLKPLLLHQLGKCLFKFEKKNPTGGPETICIKSYSDYQFVPLQDIIYLKADNNTTDIKLFNGKTVNAFKPLKHYEQTLPFYFLRIHKSYIVNINHVSRIHFSKSKCYLNYDEVLPFSLNYKNNIDGIMRKTNL